MLNLKKIEKLAQKIELDIVKRSRNKIIGNFRSQFKGQGLQFRDSLLYSYGDDIKYFDWKLLAKTGEPFTKTFEEERNVEIVVILDASISMFTGYKKISKLQVAIEICCLLYYWAYKTRDKVRVIIISNKLYNLRPACGEKGVKDFINFIIKIGILDPTGKTKFQKIPPEKRENNWNSGKVSSYFKSNKDLIFLSDFYLFYNDSTFFKWLKSTNCHFFQILSPLDSLKKMPVSMLAFDYTSHGVVNSVKELSFTKEVKQIKKINITGKYLEDFVRKLLSEYKFF